MVRVSAELLPVEGNSWDVIRQLPFRFYKLQPSSEVLTRLKDLHSVYAFAARACKNKSFVVTTVQTGEGLELVSPIELPFQALYLYGREEEESRIGLVLSRDSRPLDLNDMSQLRGFLHLFYQTQKDEFRKQGYAVRGNTVYRTDEDLAGQITLSKNSFLEKIQPSIHAYPGFNIQFRLLDGSPYIQIQPRSVLDFEKDLRSLVSEGVFTRQELQRNFEYVYLPIDRTVRLVGFTSITASDRINEDPFNGMSFIDYSHCDYGGMAWHDAAAELLVVMGSSGDPWYFTSEKVRPSISFPELARHDPQYVGSLASVLKVFSARRPKTVDKLQRDLKFGFLDHEIVTRPPLARDGHDAEIGPEHLQEADLSKPFFHFTRPWVCFKNLSGSIVDVGEPPYIAAPGDLLRHHDLRPFDAPTQVDLKVICDRKFEKEARVLLENLQKGFAKHPAFEQIFGCMLRIQDFSTVDTFEDPGIYLDIAPDAYDCVLIVGPRSIANDPIASRRIYAYAETQILSRGVPAQFVSDNPSPNPSYDSSLKTKAQNPDTLFGIGLNILGKIGSRVLELSPKSSGFFTPNSVVLAYNIGRVFEPIEDEIFHSRSPRDAVKRSTAISAPIVIMTGRGTEIIHQNVHRLSSEDLLFSEEHGPRILDEIPQEYTKIIVHKDGVFLDRELLDIKRLQTKDRLMIPISIVTGNVPRLVTSIARIHFLPRPGLLFRLSSHDFLLSTTLVTPKYIPEQRGWPNPIWVRIHGEAVPRELTGLEKLQLLYQIWCQTRLHLGSQNPIRKPISIHYSNQMYQFLRKAGDPAPSYFKTFVGKRNRHGYVPRIFM